MNARSVAALAIAFVVLMFLLAVQTDRAPRHYVETIEAERGCYIVRVYRMSSDPNGQKIQRRIEGYTRLLVNSKIAELEREHGRQATIFVIVLPVRLSDGSIEGHPMEVLVLFERPGKIPPPPDGPIF